MNPAINIDLLAQAFSVLDTPTRTAILKKSAKRKYDQMINENNLEEKNTEELSEKKDRPRDLGNLQNNDNNAQQILEPKTPIKKISQKEKIDVVVQALKDGNNSVAARDKGVSEASVRRWKKEFKDDQNVKKALSTGKKIRKSNKSKGRFPKMEEQLLEFIDEQRKKKLSVNMKDIIEEASRLLKILYPTSKFSGSNGWFWRFVNRNKLSRRTPTHVLTQSLRNCEPRYSKIFERSQGVSLPKSHQRTEKKYHMG